MNLIIWQEIMGTFLKIMNFTRDQSHSSKKVQTTTNTFKQMQIRFTCMYYLRYTLYVNTTFKKQSTFSDHLDTGKNCKGKDVTSQVF